MKLGVQFQRARAQSLGRGCVEQNRLRLPVATIRGLVFRFVFFQHYMEVGAAKPKGANSCAARMLSADPGACLRVQVKWRVFHIKLRVRLLDVNRGRQNLVMQGQGHLNHAGGACCGFGMPDLRFYASKCNVLAQRIILLENLV